jgi:hypothetical protein
MKRVPSIELDRLLARDAAADAPALRQRAAKLMKPGPRRKLAKAIERLLRDVERPQRPRRYAPERLDRAEVLRAQVALLELATVLRSERCPPRAAATASWLLRHPSSPLYEPVPSGTLARLVRRATNSR